jgi:hypothetical protein
MYQYSYFVFLLGNLYPHAYYPLYPPPPTAHPQDFLRRPTQSECLYGLGHVDTTLELRQGSLSDIIIRSRQVLVV